LTIKTDNRILLCHGWAAALMFIGASVQATAKPWLNIVERIRQNS